MNNFKNHMFLLSICLGFISFAHAQNFIKIEGPEQPIQDMYCGEMPQKANYTVINTSLKPMPISNIFIKTLLQDDAYVTRVIISENTCPEKLLPNQQCKLSINIITAKCDNQNEQFPKIVDRALVVSSNATHIESTPINLSINKAHAPLILGGQYLDIYNTMFPILYVSHDLGNLWEYKITTKENLPRDFNSDGLILFSHCDDDICLAGGAYGDAERKYPLIARSDNRGVNWQYPIQKTDNLRKLPADYSHDGMFSHLSCIASQCATIGHYVTNNGDIHPMLAVSLDSGNSWNYPVDSHHLPANFQYEGYLNAVDCAGRLCIAGGEYKINDATIEPIIVTSSNGGNDWNYIVEQNINTPENYLKNGVFREAHCTKNHCIAAGVYTGTKRNILPMVAIGSNKNNWAYKIESGAQLPLGFFDNAFIYGMHCKDNMCAVIGGYSDVEFNQYPMLLVTLDEGESWKYSVDKTKSTLPFEFKAAGALNEISCSEHVCAAVGRYKAADNIQYPLIIISHDNGNTWNYAVEKGLNQPPVPFAGNGSFSNVHCFEKRCAATGSYLDDHDAVFPMIIESTDGGHTWRYQVGSGLALPAKYKTIGGLFTVKCTKDICYSGGRYIDTNGKDFPMLVTSIKDEQPWKFIVDGAQQLPQEYSTYGYFTNR